jgi:dTDP-4-amino-4,6-dideoxygalactose transaminase
MNIPFNDLKRQFCSEEHDLRQAFERVLERGWYLSGPEAAEFEKEFATWAETAFAVSVGSGTDAIILALSVLGLEPGDEVVLPSHTAPPCYHAVLASGLIPVFAEVERDYYTLDPDSVAEAITENTRAVLAVHLYGQVCDMDRIDQVCKENGLYLIEDCAQSHGAVFNGRKAGTIGDISTFSFYPTKNLGALGDAGMICGRNPGLASELTRLKQYGENERYVSAVPGVNSRMDEMQAAFLRERLKRLDSLVAERERLAGLYTRLLQDTPVTSPAVRPGTTHAFHLYVVRCPKARELSLFLKEKGVGTAVHYPVPGHMQPMFKLSEADCGGVENLEFSYKLRNEILSLPFFPGMTDEEVKQVASLVREFYQE